MYDGHGRRTGTILGVAAGGLLLGHWLTYLVQIPDAEVRAGALGASGHGYLGVAAQFSAILAAVCVAAVFLGRLTRRDPDMRLGSTATRLATVQGSAFVAMEVLERLGAGAHLHDLTSILPIGLVAQTLVAIGGAWLLRWVLRAADAFTERLGAAGAVRPVLTWVVPTSDDHRPDAAVLSSSFIRGPPRVPSC